MASTGSPSAYSRHDEGDPERYGRLTRDSFHNLVTPHAPGVAEAGEAFLCGPAEMTQGVRDTLVGLGLSDDRIHTERFTGGAPTASPAEQEPTATAPHDVTIVDQSQEGIRGTCRAKSTGGPVRLDECDLDQAETGPATS